MNATKKTATIVGVLYIIGTVAGVLSLPVMGDILGAPDYLNKVASNPSQVALGALLVLIMGLALVMVPAMMFPILKRLNEPLAIGYVIFRGALEAFTYMALALCWLLLIIVSQQSAESGAVAASQLGSLGILLLKAQDPINAIGGIVFGLGALMFTYMLYHFRLIPRWISGWGIVAAVAYVAAGLTAMFGTTREILMMPMLLQEMVMAVWLIVKGFDGSAIASGAAKPAMNELLSAT